MGKKTRKFHRRFPPLSLLTTASLLREDGWEVAVRDLNANPSISEESVISEAGSSQWILLDTNPFADWQCPSYTIGSLLELGRKLPSDRLIVTGNHGTHYPGSILNETKALVVIREEPELAAVEIARIFADLDNHRNSADLFERLSKISGISFQKNRKNYHNPRRKLPPIETLPSPAYDLIDLKDYYYELLGRRFALLESSRGCPFSCNFCNLSMFQNRFRKRTPDRVIGELDVLVEKHGCRSLYIFDLEFAINEPMVRHICEHLIKKDYANRFGLRWACQTRADSIDNELAQLMKRSGCELIHFGVEAGNETILKNTNKRVNKDGLRKGIESAKKAEIKSAAFFMFGHPGETVENYQETIDFALELEPTYASFHPLLPFPGSPLFEQRYGASPYWEEPIKLNMSYFTPEEEKVISRFVRKAFLKFYLRPRILWNSLARGDWRLYGRQFALFRGFLVSG